jgi:hypothetical protein
MKKTTKPAAKAATKRPRTYKKADLPRTARAYLGKKYNLHMDKENEAVAKLIELHDHEARKALAFEADEMRNAYVPTVTVSRAHTKFNEENLEPAFARNHVEVIGFHQPKKLTLREQFLAWIGAK